MITENPFFFSSQYKQSTPLPFHLLFTDRLWPVPCNRKAGVGGGLERIVGCRAEIRQAPNLLANVSAFP